MDDRWAATATPPQAPDKQHIAAVCKAMALVKDGRLVTPVAGPHARLILFEQ